METAETPARPLAISIWAPYGIIPCTKQEKVSRMLALLRGSSPYLSDMSFAMPPVVIIAMVLFAVQKLASETSAAMLSSAPLLPFILRVIFSIRKSSPPATLITSSIPPASIVTIMRSPIPAMPAPIWPSQEIHPIFPIINPIMALAAIPATSTSTTLMPATAIPITRR